MPERHARFSPSAANRRLNCPPSLRLEEQFVEDESQYAAEGTAGHALAEHLIKKHLKSAPNARYPITTLTNFLKRGRICVFRHRRDRGRAARVCKPRHLRRAACRRFGLVDECFGTADAVIVTDKGANEIDLKLGKGVALYADANPQLMHYGLGVLAMAELIFDVETVRLTVFQPRLNSSSTWDITPAELKKWGEEVLRPRGAMALMGAGEFAAGSWCRFCRARNQCRARAEEFLSLAKMEFRAPALLEDDEIAEVLRKSDELAKWASDVYAFAQDQAIVHGKVWPGYKLVEGRSNRKYTSDEEVEEAAKAAGYTDIYKRSLIGIGEMEKLMGKDEFARILGSLVYKPQGKVTLAPDTDKREAINKTTALADFQEV